MHKCNANQIKGIFMLKITVMVGLCLILFPSLLALAGTTHSMATLKAEDQADTERTSTQKLHANADTEKEMIACTDPRPQVCTQDYRPVCAVLQDGSFQTFSNGCSACSDPTVTGYREGACK
jgi:hypothetical protein